jgi:hypothetical protein
MKISILTCSLLAITCATGFTHETLSHSDRFTLEAEAFVGERGYLHLGLDVSIPLNQRQTLGIVAHTVREETGGEHFPSLGAQFLHEFDGGFSLLAHAFTYLPVEEQYAWAFGLRASKSIALTSGFTVTPFFGPTYARVEAIDEATETPVTVQHLMLVGGVRLEFESVDLSVFGSHSFFDRETEGLETHVDLQEMTQLAAYENVDGFVRNTVGAEIVYSPLERLSLTARYAANFFPGEDPRHSVSFAPTVEVTESVSVSVGVQLLRCGASEDNNIGFGALSITF